MNFVPKGTMIAALAPSSAYNDAKFEAGLQILKSYGYAFHIFPNPNHPIGTSQALMNSAPHKSKRRLQIQSMGQYGRFVGGMA